VPIVKDHHYVHMVNFRKFLLVLPWTWSPTYR